MDRPDNEEPESKHSSQSGKFCARRLLSDSWNRISGRHSPKEASRSPGTSTGDSGQSPTAGHGSQDKSSLQTAERHNSGQISGEGPDNVRAGAPDSPSRSPVSFLDIENFEPWGDSRRKPRATLFLIALNVIIFTAMSLAASFDIAKRSIDVLAPLFHPDTSTLIAWGADWAPLTLSGEFWRALTCNYLHIGVAHLLVNMVILWAAGSVAEKLFGSAKYFALYTLSGLGGSAMGLLLSPTVVSAGASGAIMGICGSLIGFALVHKHEMEPVRWQQVMRGTLTYFVLCIGYGAVSHGDNGAHLGGFLTGVACGAALASSFGWLKFLGVVLMVAGLFFMDVRAPFDPDGKVLLEKVERMRWSKQYAQALAACDAAETKYPKNYSFATEAAKICLAQNDFDNALHHANLAIMINAKAPEVLETRARVFLQMNRPELAIEDLTRGLSKDPNNQTFQALRAYAYEAMNEPYLCLEDVKTLREADPDNATWLEMEAYANAEIGEVDRAINLFDELAKKKKQTDTTRVEYARMLSQKGDFGAALQVTNEINDMKSRYNTRTFIYLDKNDLGHAHQSAEAALEHNNQDSETHMTMALVYWAQAKRTEAAAEARKAYELSAGQSPRSRVYSLLLEAVAGNPIQEQEACRALAASLDDLSKSPWQGFLAKYILGKTPANYLFSMASNNNEATEAHAYTGLWSMKHGYRDFALQNFHWVMQEGNKQFSEYILVRSLFTGHAK